MEVRVLTWRRDWINALWALKTFYHHAGVDFPLHIHDGGLEPAHVSVLQSHFPDATLVLRESADKQVEAILRDKGFDRSVEYRRRNVATLKVFDYFLLSSATRVISIDSDIVFFKKPIELIRESSTVTSNLFNRDLGYAYSMPLDELDAAFGLRPPPLINSGLSLVARESMNYADIERWLHNEQLFSDHWVTEQTLHALCSAQYGVELLPDTYLVGTTPHLRPDLVCKHFPGFFRPLLYQEGMRHAMNNTSFTNVMAR